MGADHSKNINKLFTLSHMSTSVDSSETVVRVDYSDNFQEQIERYDPVSEPRCRLLIKIGGVWFSKKGNHIRDGVERFYYNLSHALKDLHDGEGKARYPLRSGMYLLFERNGSEVTVEMRYGEEDIGLEVSGTTTLTTLTDETFDGAQELLDRMSQYDDRKMPMLDRLIESVERLKRLVEN